MQKLITYIIAGLIIYLLVNTKIGQLHEEKIPESKATTIHHSATEEVTIRQEEGEPKGNFLEKSLSKVLINILKTNEGRTFFENLIQPTNTPVNLKDEGFKLDTTQLVNGLFKIQTFGDAIVGPASCGHIVNIRYQLTTLNNEILKEETQMFSLGNSDLVRGIGDVVVGMYEGQTREAIIPAAYAKDPARGANKLTVTLINIKPAVFPSPKDVQIFDDTIAYNKPCLCSEIVTFDTIIKKTNGEVVYNSEALGKKVTMHLGDLAYPMIFSYAIFNKVPVGTRTVIAQGKYMRSIALESANKIFTKDQLPKDDYFILEFKNFERSR